MPATTHRPHAMGRRSSITIEDVAKATGVSRQTVSRVINRRPGVKAAVRERIEEAILALGYVPSLAARRMGGARSQLIIAAADRREVLDSWAQDEVDGRIDRLFRAALPVCEARGYRLLLELVDPETAIEQVAALLASLGPDGLLLLDAHGEDAALQNRLDQLHCPHASPAPGRLERACTQLIDRIEAEH